MDSLLLVLHSIGIKVNPFDSASLTAESRFSFLLLQITTFAPACASFIAIALPIPFDPPETIAVFLAKLSTYFFFLRSAIAFHIDSGNLVKSENSPAPAIHSPPSIVTTSPLIYAEPSLIK